MKKKTVMLVAAIAMILCLAVGGTLAYFTDNEAAKNTFTVGKVDIELEETSEANEDKGWKAGKETADGFDYESCMPGSVYAKEPVITLAADSQPAWVFAEVEVSNYHTLMAMLKKANELEEYEDKAYDLTALNTVFLEGCTLDNSTIVKTQLTDDRTFKMVFSLGEWEPEDTQTLFEAVKIPVALDKALAVIGSDIVKLNVNAYAVQSENVTETVAIAEFFSAYDDIPVAQ